MTMSRFAKLHQALTFEQIDSRRHTVRQAYNDTCRWFLETPGYLRWLDTKQQKRHHGILMIEGNPGCGKSTLMKFLIEEKEKRDNGSSISMTLSFFFNGLGDELERTLAGMLRSFLCQIFEKYPKSRGILEDMDKHSDYRNRQCPPLDDLKRILKHIICQLSFTSLTCFVDALDECREDQVCETLKFLQEIQEKIKHKGGKVLFRICLSSRHCPKIPLDHGIGIAMESHQQHQEDMECYIRNHLHKDVARDLRIERRILSKAGNVFLWVVLVIDMLNDDFNRGNISALESTLDSMPEGLAGLFKMMLLRDKDVVDNFKLYIQWILCAQRPLKPSELHFAIWSGLPVATKGNHDAQFGRKAIDSFANGASKGLFETTIGAFPTVQFIHGSVRDFLINEGGFLILWPEYADNQLSASDPVECFLKTTHNLLRHCCSYYLFSCESASIPHDIVKDSDARAQQKERMLEKFPLSGYTVAHILDHSNECSYMYNEGDFLHRFDVRWWIELWNLLVSSSLVDDFDPDDSLYYVLVHRQLPSLIQARHKRDGKPYVEGSQPFRDAFSLAMQTSNNHVIHAFLNPDPLQALERDAPQRYMNDTSRFSTSILAMAIEVRDNRLEDRLLELGVSDNPPVLTEALLYCVVMHAPRQKLVAYLDLGASIDGTFGVYTSPWFQAVLSNNLEALRLFIERRQNPNIVAGKKFKNETAMHIAARGGRTQFVTLLLTQFPNGYLNLEARNDDGKTALHLAAQFEHQEIVRHLMEGLAGAMTRDRSQQSPLYYAASRGDEPMVRYLLAHGADPRAHDFRNTRLLHLVASHGDVRIMEILMLNGADFKYDFHEGWNVLQYAARLGREAVVRLLLAYGVDPNYRRPGEILSPSPLKLARDFGHEGVVRILLDHGADSHNMCNTDDVNLRQFSLPPTNENEHDDDGVDCLSEFAPYQAPSNRSNHVNTVPRTPGHMMRVNTGERLRRREVDIALAGIGPNREFATM